MNPNNPKPGDLAIFVRAEDVAEKCDFDCCHGRGYIDIPASQIYDGEPGANPDYYKPEPCPFCHGSGTRRVTLEGWVEIYEIRGGLEVAGLYGCPLNGRVASNLHEVITKILHDGTCPDEIREQLKVVD